MLYPWLMNIYNNISSFILDGYGHHAQLFQSLHDVKSEVLIKKLAQFILCKNKLNNISCENCQSCILFITNNHPDFHVIKLQEDKKEISVDQVRNVLNNINEYAHQNNNKVIYISDISLFNISSSNAILKTLEEPPQNCYFLIQKLGRKNILPTIYSRCQVWNINNYQQEQIIPWILSQLKHNNTDINLALNINQNDPFATLDFLQNDLQQERLAILRAFWIFYKNKNIRSLQTALKTELLDKQIYWLLIFLVDSAKYQLHIRNKLINIDIEKGIRQFTLLVNQETLFVLIKMLQKMLLDLTEATLNKDLIINYYMLTIYTAVI